MPCVKVQTSKGLKVIQFSEDEGIEMLKKKIEAESDIPAALQKLIWKGKVLDNRRTIAEQGIRDGAKILVISSRGQGLSAGQRASNKEEDRKQAAEEARRADCRSRVQTRQTLPSSSSTSIERQWRSTGIVGLRERGLKELPSKVAEIEEIRVLDLDRNEMTDFPHVEGWKKLKRLRLSNNKLGLNTEHRLSWSRLSETPSLIVLFLDNNLLVELPEEIGSCAKLEVLSLCRNRIISLHESLWSLPFLKRLDLSHNRIRDLSGIGRCGSLVELHLSYNEIETIPDEIGKLKDLTCLSLDHNRIFTLPSSLFTDCIRLHTLTMQDNPIRSEHLRDVDGYADFDRRRRSKHDKQMDMQVFFGSKGFEEIADP